MARRKARADGEHPPASLKLTDSSAEAPALGRWLIFSYEPTTLFSLKISRATSSVGRTLLIPTPYAAKMAFVDAAFKVGWQGDIAALVAAFASVDFRIGVPEQAVVSHTIIKIRQEPKDRKSGPPYIPAVAYREFVYLQGRLRWAFDLATAPHWLAAALIEIAPGINYVGKRGSFVQFVGYNREIELGPAFTQPLNSGELKLSSGMQIAELDDFGPEANFEALNSFSAVPIRRDRHRVLRETLVPLGLVNVGPGFSEYSQKAG